MPSNSTFLPLYNNPLHQTTLHYSQSGALGNTIPPSDLYVNKQATFKRKSSLKVTTNVGNNLENTTSTLLKHVRWNTPDSETVPLSYNFSDLSLTPHSAVPHNAQYLNEGALLPEQSQEVPPAETSCKPDIVVFTAYKPIHANQSRNDITRANIRHLLKKISFDHALAQSSSDLPNINLSSQLAAKGTHPEGQPHGLDEYVPASASPLSHLQPQNSSLIPLPKEHNQLYPPTSSRLPPSRGPDNHALSIGHGDHSVRAPDDSSLFHQSNQANGLGVYNINEMDMGKVKNQKINSTGEQEPNNHRDSTILKTSSTSRTPPTAPRPLVSQGVSHEYHTVKFQVARRTGGMVGMNKQGISSEGTTAHAGTKRKRHCNNLDIPDRPGKATRRDKGEQPESRTGHAPETSNTSSERSEPHALRAAGQSLQESARLLPSLRDMGKIDRRNYDNLINTLSTIKTNQGHRDLTPRMLKETKLAKELYKFVDQSSTSPESTLAIEIYTHWRCTFGDRL